MPNSYDELINFQIAALESQSPVPWLHG